MPLVSTFAGAILVGAVHEAHVQTHLPRKLSAVPDEPFVDVRLRTLRIDHLVARGSRDRRRRDVGGEQPVVKGVVVVSVAGGPVPSCGQIQPLRKVADPVPVCADDVLLVGGEGVGCSKSRANREAVLSL